VPSRDRARPHRPFVALFISRYPMNRRSSETSDEPYGGAMRRSLVAVCLVFAGVAACADDDSSSGTGSTATAAPSTSSGSTTATTEARATTTTTVPELASTTTTAPVVAGPFAPGADWEVQSPESQGMDAAALDQARAYAFTEGRNTQGVVVVRHGVVVAEWYAAGAGPDSWAASWSMGKSFTSALIGIAIEEGLIPSVDEPMATYFPDWKGTPREAITIRHVLQMAAGLAWNEDYDPAAIDQSDVIQLVLFNPDQLAYASARLAESEPGSVFNYSSGATLLLSGVLEQATGMKASAYAAERLFGPLGIDQVEWWEDASGHTLTYCCVDTTTRDFARFGLLYLRGGAWGDQQVVPADWIADSITPSPAEKGYGYQWWLTGNTEGDVPADMYSARGHDGQYIYVIPSLDLVVVRNGTYVKYDGPPIADPNLFEKYPSDCLVPGQGTCEPRPDVGWNDADFLTPIVESTRS